MRIFWVSSFLSYKRTLKQQLNGENETFEKENTTNYTQKLDLQCLAHKFQVYLHVKLQALV